MAEEIKQEKREEDVDKKNMLSTIFKVILGIVFLVLGIWAILAWRAQLWTVIRGCMGLFLVLAAVITLAIAKE